MEYRLVAPVPSMGHPKAWILRLAFATLRLRDLRRPNDLTTPTLSPCQISWRTLARVFQSSGTVGMAINPTVRQTIAIAMGPVQRQALRGPDQPHLARSTLL